jgi:hypothetical protein
VIYFQWYIYRKLFMTMKAEGINIGMKLNHREKGEITVLGIAPHCGDYCITINEGWVYLKNCTLIN